MLLVSNTVVAFQETHADDLDSDAFQTKWGHSHCMFFSNAFLKNQGGVAICIKKCWLVDALCYFAVEIVVGRALAVFILFLSYTIVVINIHNAQVGTPDSGRRCIGRSRN